MTAAVISIIIMAASHQFWQYTSMGEDASDAPHLNLAYPFAIGIARLVVRSTVVLSLQPASFLLENRAAIDFKD